MNASSAVRLLRSPPFPGIDPTVASVDLGERDWHGVDPARVCSVARSMAVARVGGTFWAQAQIGRERLIVADDAASANADPDALVVMARGAAAPVGATKWCEVDAWSSGESAEIVAAPTGGEGGVLAILAEKLPLTFDGGLSEEECGPLTRALFSRRYRDPFSGAEIDAEDAIEVLRRWRELIDANRGISAAVGMAFWKRSEVARLLWDGRPGNIPFLTPEAAIARAAREGGAIAAWPARVPLDFAEQAAAKGLSIRWVEDGFLRSAGLGSDLLPPLSLVVDDLWPYFDPARASRLEVILETGEFDTALLQRAAALRAIIVERRIGKYSVGGVADTADLPVSKRLALVVGQVEDDLSMLRGGAGMTNLALLQSARAAEPDAYIVYRPHPDVEAGHRKGAIADATVLKIADRIDRGGSLDALLARADVLHTITSLSGFEALMRGVRVVVHGSPFYAGWGLTDDRGPPLPRRTRRLTLDQLVAGALILYPRYLDARTGLPCTPEQFIEGLGGVGAHAGWLVRLRRWQGRLMRRLGAR